MSIPTQTMDNSRTSDVILQAIAQEGRSGAQDRGRIMTDIGNTKADVLSSIGHEHGALAKDIGDTKASVLSSIGTEGRTSAGEHCAIEKNIGDTRASILHAMGSEGRQTASEHMSIDKNVSDTRGTLLHAMGSEGRQNAAEHAALERGVGGVRSDLLANLGQNFRISTNEVVDSKAAILNEMGRGTTSLSRGQETIRTDIANSRSEVLSKVGDARSDVLSKVGDSSTHLSDLLGENFRITTNEIGDARTDVVQQCESTKNAIADARSDVLGKVGETSTNLANVKSDLLDRTGQNFQNTDREVQNVKGAVASVYGEVALKAEAGKKLQYKLQGNLNNNFAQGLGNSNVQNSNHFAHLEREILHNRMDTKTSALKVSQQASKEAGKTRAYVAEQSKEGVLATLQSRAQLELQQEKNFAKTNLLQEKTRKDVKEAQLKNKLAVEKSQNKIMQQASDNARVLELEGLRNKEQILLLIKDSASQTQEKMAGQESRRLEDKVNGLREKLIMQKIDCCCCKKKD